MKHMKKWSAILMALVMTLALSLPALATGSTGSITIQNAEEGQVYTIYRILDLESYNADTGAYAYKAASLWSTFINSTDIKGVYLNVDDQGYVTWKEGADPAAFAKAAQQYAADNSITNQGSQTAQKSSGTSTAITVTFTNLPLGYYLIDTTLGTLCALDTTNPNAEVQEKNEVPVQVKTVEEDSTGVYGAQNDADIGQTVNFHSTITARAGAENYVFHDTMSAGLTYNGVTSITMNGTAVAENNYSVVTTGLTDGCTFEVRFTQAFCDTLADNDSIVISYAAVLNENAVVGSTGNPNTAKLSYGDASHLTYTPDSQTKTYTWDVDVLKYTMVQNPDQEEQEQLPLAGAVFTLSLKPASTTTTPTPIALIDKGNNVYRVAKSGENNTVTQITTDSTGSFTIQGLDSDTYLLTEITAPSGYNVLPAPIVLTINAEGQTTVDNTVVDTVMVLNQTGALLPETGGMGTTLFYTVGTVLVLGAGVLLVTKKRMNTAE